MKFFQHYTSENIQLSQKNTGYTLNQINEALKKYNCLPVSKNFKMFGPDQDEADAIISVAALKYFSKKKNTGKFIKQQKRRLDLRC